jgi:hypothetical protein
MRGVMKDRWGNYKLLTGLESTETCFWCGARTWKRYCSKECQTHYLNNFSWLFASAWCLERYHNKCGDCGTKKVIYDQDIKCEYSESIGSGYCNNECGYRGRREKCFIVDGLCTKYASDEVQLNTKMEVHHIDPMCGEDRGWSVKNRPENLICLCHKCHKEWNKKGECGEKIRADRKQKIGKRMELIKKATQDNRYNIQLLLDFERK